MMETLMQVVERDEKNVVLITNPPDHFDLIEVIGRIDYPLEVFLSDDQIIVSQKDDVWSIEQAQKIANSIVTAIKIFTSAGFRYTKFGM